MKWYLRGKQFFGTSTPTRVSHVQKLDSRDFDCAITYQLSSFYDDETVEVDSPLVHHTQR